MPTAPVSIFSVAAVLLLSVSDGTRILAKYYLNPYPTVALQKSFEKGLHAKTQKPASQPGAGDIILYDNKIVVFKQEGDVAMYVVGGAQENEMLLWHVLLGWRDALNILLKNNTDRRTLLENYDLVTLCLDEILDDGIILETEPVAVASRVSRAPTQEVGGAAGLRNLDLSEQGLLNAWEYGRNQLRERLRQGL
ncbi:clathrin adaptor complex small chain [Terfezia claveryi]|nr:clathrin adaptor complex small chain [Terfezia claveryi]